MRIEVGDLIAGIGRLGGRLPLKPAVTGFTRLDDHFCILSSSATLPSHVFSGTGWVEADFADNFATVPSAMKWVLLRGALSFFACSSAGANNGYTFQTGDGSVVFQSMGGKVRETTAFSNGLQLAEQSIIINAPVHSASKIWANGLVFGGGGNATMRVAGYWD